MPEQQDDLNALLNDATDAPDSAGIPDTERDPSRENPGDNAISAREGYAWAADCFWAYDNMGGKMTQAKAGSAGRYYQWKMATKNPEQYVMQVLPRAMTMLEKARDKAGDDANVVVRAEEKQIAELQSILTAAIAESRAGGG